MTPAESFEQWLDARFGPLPSEGGGTPQTPEGFVIDNDQLASWALRKLQRLEAEAAERRAYVEAEIARVRQWAMDLDQRDARERLFFEGLLHGYLQRLREAGTLGERRSYRLPQGTLQFRAVSIDYEVVDPDAFLAWAQAQGLTRVKEEPRWGDIKKGLQAEQPSIGAGVTAERINEASGEVTQERVPGVQVSRAPGETFSIRFADVKEGA